MLSAHSRAHVDCVSRVVKNANQLPQLPVPDLILDSWRRSMEQHHLDPGSLQGPRILSQDVLKQCRERSELFLNIASEEVARLHGRVRDADYCVLLTDAQGQTIDYRVETTIRNDCRKAGLYLGTCWSEGEEGTCGVAAVLTAKAPVTVHKRDHFRAAFIGLTCSAAPVFDPQGELLGVLDVSAVRSPDDRRSQHLIRQMVVQSAREIEQAFFMSSAQGYWVLRAHRNAGYVDSQPDFLFAWDDDGCLQALNPAARQYLLQHYGQLPQHIGQVFDQQLLHRARDESLCSLDHAMHGRLSAPRQRASSRSRVAMTPLEIDPRLADSLRLAVRVKDRNLPVLIQGETGSGKEVFARQLHQASQRRDRPFVALNCAAIPESLIESELFGYVAGAFTGASAKGMQGLLQQADGGTLFLDEIGDMPLALQTRLLRVLAEGEVAPLGASRRKAVDIQVICATHRDLETLVAAGEFREDLYFRLGGARFQLPPVARTQRSAGVDQSNSCRGVDAVRGDSAIEQRGPGMPARLSLAGQCAPAAPCAALCVRGVRSQRGPAQPPARINAPRGRHRPRTGTERQPGTPGTARCLGAPPLETHRRRPGPGHFPGDPVSTGKPAWHRNARPQPGLRAYRRASS